MSHKGNSACFWLIGINSCEAMHKNVVHVLKLLILPTKFPSGLTSLCQESVHGSLSEGNFRSLLKHDIQLSLYTTAAFQSQIVSLSTCPRSNRMNP